MRVTMKAQVSGLRDGEPWPPVGGVIDVPDDEAVSLIAQSLATDDATDEAAEPADDQADAPAEPAKKAYRPRKKATGG